MIQLLLGLYIIKLGRMVIFKRNFFAILVVAVLMLGFLLRFYKLSEIPNGLYPDETAIGYNAYSILQSGKDEYGQSYPFYFRSFDDYKLPVYIYLTVLSEKLFDATPFAVRLPSALFGTLSIVILYFLLFEVSKKKWFALVGAVFLTLNPWHLFFSRAGYEVNVATALILLGVYLFICAVNRKNNIFLISLSTVPFLLSVYTYNVTRLMAPLILIALFLFYSRKLAKNKKNFVFPFSIFLLGMVPFLITFISMQSQEGFAAHRDGLIIGNQIKAQLIETRSYFIGLPDFLEKTVFNYWMLVAFTYFKNLVSFFSTSFYFVAGSDKPNQNLSAGLSMFYYYDFFLIILGIYEGIKRKASFLYPFYIWFLVVLFFGSLVIIVPNGTRTYPVVVPLVVFASYGFYVAFNSILKLKGSVLKWGSVVSISGVILYSVAFYLLSYFVRFPIDLAEDWKSEDKKLVEYILNNNGDYSKIVFDESAEIVYTNFLFYSKFPPDIYHLSAVSEQKGLVRVLQKVDKYEFRKINWSSEMKERNVLFVTGESSKPEGIAPIKIFTYPTKSLAVYYDRQIGQYPLSKVAYILYKSEGDKSLAKSVRYRN